MNEVGGRRRRYLVSPGGELGRQLIHPATTRFGAAAHGAAVAALSARGAAITAGMLQKKECIFYS